MGRIFRRQGKRTVRIKFVIQKKLKEDTQMFALKLKNFQHINTSEIKFAKFEFEKGDENILVSIERGGITSALYFDIDNDGKKEIIKKHSSTPPSTSLPQVIQTTIYYKSENDQKEKKYKNVGCFSTSGATELFSYKNKNYVFDIPYIIDNNYEISEFYKNNHLDNSNMEVSEISSREIYL